MRKTVISRRGAIVATLAPLFVDGLVMTRTAQAREAGNGRTLVAYLSRSGNTRVIAGELQRHYRANLFEIRVADPYPEDYEEMVDWARQLRDARATPALAESVASFERFKSVFLGFPIWGGALPAPVRTFLTTHDFSRKTLVLFVTHGGYGIGSAQQTVADLAPDARHVKPFVLKRDQERDALTSVSAWLSNIELEL